MFEAMHFPSPPLNCSQKNETGQHWKVKRKKKNKLYSSMEIREIQRMMRWVRSTAILSKKMPMLALRTKFVNT